MMSSCKKKMAPQPEITTYDITSISYNNAVCGGFINSDDDFTILTKGVCWSTSQNPTVENDKTENGSETGSFESMLTSLSPGTTYFVRAYATTTEGTFYGNQKNFSTLSASLPVIGTYPATSITNATAVSGGKITSNGGSDVTARGVCWSKNPNPTIADLKTSNGTGTGPFISNLLFLTANTTYYVRAYATNSSGTAYGGQQTFKTAAFPTVPTVTTSDINDITYATATGGGNVTSEGSTPVTARGICWSKNPNPTIADTKTTNGTGSGVFNSNLVFLTSNTTYYVRAYATNSSGTAYGNEVVFKSGFLCGSNSVTDIDGNTYGTVLYGGKCWMNKNLKTSKYNDGTAISNITIPLQWANISYGAWCNYNNTASFNAVHGKLYNWYAVNSGKLCPEGWHIPTKAEWTQLISHLGGNSVAGGKMKATSIWDAPNTGATNESNFTAYPSGIRLNNGDFLLIKLYAYWWSTNSVSSNIAVGYYLWNLTEEIYEINDEKKMGMSCRCVKD